MNQPNTPTLGPGLDDVVLRWARTGSSYTCYPPVTTTDVDWLVLLRHDEDLMEFCDSLMRAGWHDCLVDDPAIKESYKNDPAYGTLWLALRKDEHNIMITTSQTWWLRALAATELCRRLNVRSKDDRIAIFRCIRDNVFDLDWLVLP
jgi:hypothetical protein